MLADDNGFKVRFHGAMEDGCIVMVAQPIQVGKLREFINTIHWAYGQMELRIIEQTGDGKRHDITDAILRDGDPMTPERLESIRNVLNAHGLGDLEVLETYEEELRMQHADDYAIS